MCRWRPHICKMAPSHLHSRVRGGNSRFPHKLSESDVRTVELLHIRGGTQFFKGQVHRIQEEAGCAPSAEVPRPFRKNERGIVVFSAPDVQVTAAIGVYNLVVHHHGQISFQQRVRAQDCIVRLNHDGRDLRTGPHRETEFRYFSLSTDRSVRSISPRPEPDLNHMRSTPRNLQGTCSCQLPCATQQEIDDLVRNCWRRLLFPRSVARSERASSFREESVESVVSYTDAFVTGHLAVRHT